MSRHQQFTSLRLPNGDYTVRTDNGTTQGKFATQADAARHAALNGTGKDGTLKDFLLRLVAILDGSRGELSFCPTEQRAQDK